MRAFSQPTAVPSLESGDRLTRAEFERRYGARPDLKKAELVEGVVYLPSPVRASSHGRPHSYLMGWLATYVAATPGVESADNATVRLDARNELQPDALLRIEAACGGQSRINAEDYIEGAPELVVEVAASSAAYDLHDKREAYRRHGVQEYLVWVPSEGELRWAERQADAFVPLAADGQGRVRSRAFPGLVLDRAALLAGDLAAVLARQHQAVATEAHRAFVERLQASRKG